MPVSFDEAKLNQFMGKMVADIGAATNAALVLIGDKLGLYKALFQGGPATSAELAKRTATTERYVREWLSAQAASGYVEYDAKTGKFSMTPEQALVFTAEQSPVYLMGAFHVISALLHDEPKITEAFRTGKGVGWGEHDHSLFCGTAKFFKTTYQMFLVNQWIPALEGVKAKLERGAKVADVGCGHGVSTVMMAQAFPNSQFFGYDIHEPSIQAARQLAAEAGVANVTFEVAAAKTFPGNDYDLIAFFDCLHDMGDPAGASAHVRKSLKQDGTWMIVEPFAHDEIEKNLNPIGRIFYASSTMLCTPASLAQEVGLALGAQAGEKRLSEVIRAGGFTTIRRAAETPFNIVYEAR